MTCGTSNAYQSGCRCDECRLAHKVYMSRYRGRRERRGGRITEHGIEGGHLCEPVGDLPELVDQLVAAVGFRRSAALTGLSTRTIRELRHAVRDRVHPRVATVVRAAWADHCAPLPDVRWPTAPLMAAARGRLSLLSSSDRRYLYRSETIDSGRADRICTLLGLYPENLWPDWFGGEVSA